MALTEPSPGETSNIGGDSRVYNERRESHPPESLSPDAKALIFLLPVVLIILFFLTKAPLIVLATTVVSLSPVALAVYVITRLGDAELPKSFLVEQIFWGAVPGFLGAFLAEMVLVIFAALTFLRSDLLHLSSQQVKNTPFAIARVFGVWKIVLLALLVSYVLAAGVEESAKVLIGARSKKLISGGSRDANLSPRSVVASVMAGALGLAATEHFFFSLQIFLGIRRRKVLSLVTDLLLASGISILRAALALPVHCGTALLIGVAMAKKFVLKQNVKIFWAFMLAILVHGTFDAVSMVIRGLILVKALPATAWLTVVVMVADITIAIVLMLLCRSAYKSLSSNNGYSTLGGDGIV